MSNSGKFTSLGLNVLNGLMSNRGFRLNPVGVQNYGIWTPQSIIQGKIVNDTVLNKITYARNQILENLVPNKFSVQNWRKLFEIGNGVCPALSNTFSSKFIPTYPGYGTWGNKSIDQYGNVISDITDISLIESIYPPKNYGKEKTFSYIFQKYNDYAWVTGWPGKNNWQEELDDYNAVYKPDINEASVTEYDRYISNGFLNLIARQGYYEFWSSYDGRRPNQYKEFIKFLLTVYQYKQNANTTTSSFVNTKNFIKGNYSNINDITTSDIAGVNLAFSAFGLEMIQLGKSLDLSNIHLFGLPSKFLLNLQAVNGFTESLKMALILSDFDVVELDDVLSSTYTPSSVQEKKIYNALTMVRGQDLDEIKIILNCSTAQLDSLADLINPKKMFPTSYRSLTVPEYRIDIPSIKNYDLIYNGDSVNPMINNWGDYLEDILPQHLAIACGAFMVSMNQIKNIRQMESEKLAQVIINLESTNKDLPLINSTYSTPGDIPAANEALSSMAFGSGNSNIYKFIDFVGALSGIPYNDILSTIYTKINLLPTNDLNNVYQKIFQKSLGNSWELLGNDSILYKNVVSVEINGSIVQCTPGASEWLSVGDNVIFSDTALVDATNTEVYEIIDINDDLLTLNTSLVNGLTYGNFIYKYNDQYDNINTLVQVCNNIIQNLTERYQPILVEINQLWDRINNQLSVEQRAIPLALKESMNIPDSTDISDIEIFVKNLESYAKETEYGEIAHVLENISDLSNLYGQSIVGLLREARNAERLVNTGGELDNDISDTLNINAASAYVVIEDGKISDVIITSNGNGYITTPMILVAPQGGIFGGSGQGGELTAVLDDTGSLIDVIINNPGFGYDSSNPPELIISEPDVFPRYGKPIVIGSFSGSPYTDQDPVIDKLLVPPGRSFTVDQAIEEIIRCKCDC